MINNIPRTAPAGLADGFPEIIIKIQQHRKTSQQSEIPRQYLRKFLLFQSLPICRKSFYTENLHAKGPGMEKTERCDENLRSRPVLVYLDAHVRLSFLFWRQPVCAPTPIGLDLPVFILNSVHLNSQQSSGPLILWLLVIGMNTTGRPQGNQ